MALSVRTSDLLRHLAGRPGHDEVKADFRQLLIEEFGAELANLDFERRVPEVKGRIDALIGRTVFEAKSNLDKEWSDVEKRMPDYLAGREREENERFVGVASDGQKWAIFELAAGALTRVKDTTLDPDKPEVFLAWLDGALALKGSLSPDPLTIRSELGQDSVAYHRASQELAALWDKVKNAPAVTLKRQLWSSLLKLVYGREVENDSLWFQHTFLVVVAKAIALAILGLRDDDPKRVLSGAAFEQASIFGAVESDFFDWVVAHPDGEALVRRILNHVRRFRLAEVESDVLKVLYESLIERSDRHGLGEYYTPDWLAAKIVRHAVDRPLEQKVLDPACGSGTFLFHAVRNFLAEAAEGDMNVKLRAAEAADFVAGLDIHPVAVIIARVTYLLALAPVIQQRGGPLYIPVYLADSMQLSTNLELAGKELTITIPDPPGYVEKDNGKIGHEKRALKFPEILCKEIRLFDQLIAKMRDGSEQGQTREQVEPMFTLEIERYYKREITTAEAHGVADLGATYVVFDQLRREGRDSVWTYVARNLSRPLALAFNNGWANVVVGNPPWVSFRHMSADLQKRFKELAKGEKVHVGGKFGTQSDLSGLFTVRSVAFYLRPSGRIAFVLPLAALTRGQFEKFRTGSFYSTRIAWDEAWTMDDTVQPLFPVPSCVVFGRKRATAKLMPDTVTAYSGDLPYRDAHEDVADKVFGTPPVVPKPVEGVFTGGSAYRKAFRQGASLVPRMLCIVERKSVGKLGNDPTAPFVESRRSSQEKSPWKEKPSIESRVESDYLRTVLSGESIVPYRIVYPFEGVIPVAENGELLDEGTAAKRGHAGLATWLRQAEKVWAEDRPSGITLSQQLDYYGKLTAQFPIKQLRVVYAKAGTLPAASVLRDADVIDHMLYWATVTTENEALYLAGILNSETARSRVASKQSRGQWGARHFDKVMFTLPIPRFDAKDGLHGEIAKAAHDAETIAASVPLSESVKFQRARKLVRDALTEAGVARRIDKLVTDLLDGHS